MIVAIIYSIESCFQSAFVRFDSALITLIIAVVNATVKPNIKRVKNARTEERGSLLLCLQANGVERTVSSTDEPSVQAIAMTSRT